MSQNLLRGRPIGMKNKRTVEGEEYAVGILVQDDEDILQATTEKGIVETDRHERAMRDPVYRVLRAQARNGVGTMPGQLPPAVFASLSDRAFGKVMDKLKLSAGRPLATETDEELRTRLDSLQRALGPAAVEEVA